MTQVSGSLPALYDGVGAGGKKKPAKKVVRLSIKDKLLALQKAVKG